MYLKDILEGVRFSTGDDIEGLVVRSVACDSRSVERGGLFIAVKGSSLDGSKFIDEAIRRGAGAVVAEDDFNAPKGVTKILVSDSRMALAAIADNFYAHPSSALKMVGVTGTNGKTTITYLVENIIKSAGKDAGVIGTINYRLKDRILPARNTTPGPLELESMLAEMVKEGLGYAVMEVSSHSLDQRRVERVLFDVGIFTNVTGEHLDYHKTIDNYFKAKGRLFDGLKRGGIAILNNDDALVAGLANSIKQKVITYAVNKDADVTAREMQLSLDGSSFIAATPKGAIRIKTRLMGSHNISNILAAIAAGLALGGKEDAIKKGIESTALVPGRLESIDAGQTFKVFVDYAHTEDALRNVLSLLRAVAKEKIITVFGCGGNRDRTKRPLMAETACRLSDRVIITSDNPRFEEPLQIIDEIEVGVKGKFSNYDIMADRHSAIELALKTASGNDIVIIAGKGHEDYQIVKDRATPFDDRKVAREVLKSIYEGKRDIKGNARQAVIG